MIRHRVQKQRMQKWNKTFLSNQIIWPITITMATDRILNIPRGAWYNNVPPILLLKLRHDISHPALPSHDVSSPSALR